MKIVYKVWSDNFDGDFLSVEAYEASMLSMSTGDYHLHRAKQIRLESIPVISDILCYDPSTDEWYTLSPMEIGA